MIDLGSWTQPLYVAGWILASGVALVFLANLMGLRRRQQLLARVHDREIDLLDARISRIRAARKVLEGRAESGWFGIANFVVSKKVRHAESGICSFYLKPKDKRLKLAQFLPGQHLVFQLPAPGEAQSLSRRYSLSDSPNGEYYRISVKRLEAPKDAPADAPAGLGSGGNRLARQFEAKTWLSTIPPSAGDSTNRPSSAARPVSSRSQNPSGRPPGDN